jgi:glycosyltransferase involved in cell wall biosynthesis
VKPSVSILSHTLSSNAFGRAWVLAELLGEDFDVHVVVACSRDEQMWAPARGSFRFELRRWDPEPYPSFGRRARAAARELVTGDIIYAVKPRLGSFGLGLVAKRVQDKPLVLDVDDWELGFTSPWVDLLRAPWALYSSASSFHTRMLDRRRKQVDAVTVSSEFLAARYGGVWIPHARDEHVLRAEPVSTSGGEKTVVFIGTPRRHKGLLDLVEAFEHVRTPAKLRLIGGAMDKTLVERVRKGGDARISVEAPVPMSELPGLLGAADLVVIPQSARSVSQAQLPAKLLDAMAMGRPILSTRVGDIPRWLSDGAGVVVEPGDTRALGEAMESILSDPHAARALGEKARARFLEYGSTTRVRPQLVRLMKHVMAGQPGYAQAPFSTPEQVSAR